MFKKKNTTVEYNTKKCGCKDSCNCGDGDIFDKPVSIILQKGDKGDKGDIGSVTASQGLHVDLTSGDVQIGGDYSFGNDGTAFIIGNITNSDKPFIAFAGSTDTFTLGVLGNGKLSGRNASVLVQDVPNLSVSQVSIAAQDVNLKGRSITLTNAPIGTTGVMKVIDTIGFKGLENDEDFSANWTDNSLITKKWALDTFGVGSNLTFNNGLTRTGDNVKLGGIITEPTIIADVNNGTVFALIPNGGIAGQATNGDGSGNTSFGFGGDNLNLKKIRNSLEQSISFLQGNNPITIKDDVLHRGLTGSELFTITDPEDYVQAGNVGLLSASGNSLEKYLRIAAWGDSFIGGVGDVTILRFPNALTNNSGIYTANNGFPGQTSTYIKNQFIANTSQRDNAVLIWSGKNNFNQISTIVSDIRSMVDLLDHNNYIVLSVFNSDIPTQYQGTADYNTILALNAALEVEFGDHYLNVRDFIISQYNPSLPADVLAHSRDVPPPSLMFDETHMNSAGNILAAQFVVDNFQYLFREDNRLLTGKSIPSVFKKAGITFSSDTKELISENLIISEGISSAKSLGTNPINSDTGTLLTLNNNSYIQEGVVNPETRIITLGQRNNNAFMRLFKDAFVIRNASDSASIFSFGSNGDFTALGNFETDGTALVFPSLGASPSNLDAGGVLILANKSLSGDQRLLTIGQIGGETFFRMFQNISYRAAGSGQELFYIHTDGTWGSFSSGIVNGNLTLKNPESDNVLSFDISDLISGIQAYQGDGVTVKPLSLNPEGGSVKTVSLSGTGTRPVAAAADGTLGVLAVDEYADNAAALTGGLVAGQFYRTGDLLKVVH